MKNIQRTYLPGSNWVYFKIYTGVVTADKILINDIIHFISKLKLDGLIDKWFFIRYTDPDFHLRVRVQVRNVIDIGSIILLFYSKLKRLEARNLIFKVQIDTYQRELERYNKELIEDTEYFFYIDSEYMIKIIKQILNSNENNRWIIAFKMIDSILSDLSFTLEQKLILMERQSSGFKKEFGFNEFNAKQFNKKYRDCTKIIQNVINEKENTDKTLKQMFEIIHKRSIELRPTFLKIFKKCQKVKIDYLILSGDYIHMMLNRLFYEKARVHELIIYDFLRRYYTSEVAKLKHNIKNS